MTLREWIHGKESKEGTLRHETGHAKRFVRKHPVATVVGGALLGGVGGALLGGGAVIVSKKDKRRKKKK